MNPVRSFVTRNSGYRTSNQKQSDPFTEQIDLRAHAHPQTDAQSDRAMIAACLNGDETAWNLLVEKYGRLVYWIAGRRTRTVKEADEVFEGVFGQLVRSLSQLRHEDSLALWLTIMTRREADRFGPDKTSRPAVNHDSSAASQPLPDAEQRQLLWEQVLCAIWQLDIFSREFLLACMADPAPRPDELAARFNMPEQNIGLTRRRCLRELESVLATMGISNVDDLKSG